MGHSENNGGLVVPEGLADHITRVTDFSEAFGASVGFPNGIKALDNWSAGARIGSTG